MSESSPLLENIHLRHNMHIAELRFYLRQHPGRSGHLLEKAVSVPLPRFVGQSPTFIAGKLQSRCLIRRTSPDRRHPWSETIGEHLQRSAMIVAACARAGTPAEP